MSAGHGARNDPPGPVVGHCGRILASRSPGDRRPRAGAGLPAARGRGRDPRDLRLRRRRGVRRRSAHFVNCSGSGRPYLAWAAFSLPVLM